MKKPITFLLLAILLLAALPALASPTGASPQDIAIWQATVPAPQGEFAKITAVLGEGAAPTIQRRLDQSQRGPVIDNTPRFVLAGKTILGYIPVDELFDMLSVTTFYWVYPPQTGNQISNGDIVHDQRNDTYHIVTAINLPDFFGSDPDAFLRASTAPLPDDIPFYAQADYDAGLLVAGEFFRDAADELHQLYQKANSAQIELIYVSLMSQFIILAP